MRKFMFMLKLYMQIMGAIIQLTIDIAYQDIK